MQVRLAMLLLLSWLLWLLNARADSKVFSQVTAVSYTDNSNVELRKYAKQIFGTYTTSSGQVRRVAASVIRSGRGYSALFTLVP